jgi:hypothetical protein
MRSMALLGSLIPGSWIRIRSSPWVEHRLFHVGDLLLAELQGHPLAPLDGVGGLDLQVWELIGEDLLEIGAGFLGW